MTDTSRSRETELKEFDSCDYLDATTIKLLVGSQHKIIIEKLYGPTIAKDLVIVWEGDDWNIRNKRQQLIEKGIAEGKKDKLAFGKEMYDKGKEVGESKGYAKALADVDKKIDEWFSKRIPDIDSDCGERIVDTDDVKELKQSIKELGK